MKLDPEEAKKILTDLAFDEEKVPDMKTFEALRCGVQALTEYQKTKAKKLWMEFEDIPINPETEEIEVDWNGFSAGTFREDIWHWFEETFHISVAEDLMGL